jgi:hypothetical protein
MRASVRHPGASEKSIVLILTIRRTFQSSFAGRQAQRRALDVLEETVFTHAQELAGPDSYLAQWTHREFGRQTPRAVDRH